MRHVIRWLLLVALAVPFRAEATLIARDLVPSYDGWSLGPYVGAVTYDTDTGLEWLDLTQTEGQILTTVNGDSYHNPLNWGWRYATRAEVCGLLEPRTGPIFGCSGRPADFGSYQGIGEIQEFLGVTDEEGPPLGAYSFGLFGTGEVQMLVVPVDHFAVAIVADRPDDPPDGGSGIGHLLVRRVPEPGTALLLACLMLAVAAVRFTR
ncbi:MAG: hypothetical protein ACKVZ0_25490 [Gemmatimonadales bacterium]